MTPPTVAQDPLAAEVGESLKSRAARGMLWMGGSRVFMQILDQLFTVVLIRLLVPSDFGLIAMAAVFTSLLRLFSDMGLGPAIVQRASIDQEYLSTALWGNLVFGLLCCGAVLGAAGPTAGFFGQPQLSPVLAVLSLRFVFAAVSVTQEALLIRQMRYAALTSRNMLSVALGGTVGILLALAGLGVWSLVAQALVMFGSNAALVWLATTWRPRLEFSWTKFKDLWNFGIRVLGSRFFSYVIRNFDSLLVGRLLGATMLGYYALAYNLFLVPVMNVTQIMVPVVFSAFSRLQGDLDRLRRGFGVTTRFVSFFAFPALLGFFLVVPDLVTVLIGEKWMPVVPVVRVLLVAGLLLSHVNIWVAVFQAMGKVDWLLRLSFLSAVLYVLAFMVGIRWGIVGVACGYTATTLVLMPVQLALIQRLIALRLQEYFSSMAPFAVASAAMGICVSVAMASLANQGSATRLAAAIVVGVLSYALVMMAIRWEFVGELIQVVRDLRGMRPARSTVGAVEG